MVERLPTSTSKASFDYKAKRFVRSAHLPPLERHHGWKEIFSADARAELTGRSSIFDPVDVYRSRYRETEGADGLARLQDVDFGIYLVDDLLVKTDRASMAHSLEARVPFLDPIVTNLAFALPAHHKVRGLSKKVLLRKAVAPLLPREVVHGRKRGFSIPAAAWLRGELEPFARATLSADTLRRQGFFRTETVSRLIDEHVARRRGPEPPAVGPAGVHALVRASRRAGAAAPPLRPDGVAARVTDYPPFGLGYPRTELRRQLVDAVLAGAKTATAGLAEEYAAESEAVPVAGDRFVLEGFDEEPLAIVEVTDAQVVPASEIDVQFARDEGEGFETVEDWRVAHEKFFGRPIQPETEIVAIRFRVVEVLA